MDTQTRHALKQDSFVQATTTSIGWAQAHRNEIVRIALPSVVALIAILAAVAVYNQRSEAADVALGKALTTYSAPLRQAGMPDAMAATSFASTEDRAAAANRQFVETANRYGMLPAGKNALYFAGVTAIEMGQTADAEKYLKKTAQSGNANLSSLSKLALAGLYRQTNRDSEAIDLYKQLIAKPTSTVPAATAQLQLAGLYETSRPDEAKKIYAEVKDKDKTGAAGKIAAGKLSGPAAATGQTTP